MEKHFEEEWRRKWFDVMKKFSETVMHGFVPWTWNLLSENSNATMEFIFANIDNPWNWDYVSSNVNLTLDTVLANPDKQWDWENLTRNPNITDSQMNDHPDLPWKTREMYVHEYRETFVVYLSKKPRTIISPFIPIITQLESLQMLQSVMKQPDDNCNYGHVAWDDNLPLSFVANHIKKFEEHMFGIYYNEFTTDKHYYVQHYMKWMHIMTIYETHMENTNVINYSNLLSIEYILFDEFLVLNLLKH